jgi:hypothetical protein
LRPSVFTGKVAPASGPQIIRPITARRRIEAKLSEPGHCLRILTPTRLSEANAPAHRARPERARAAGGQNNGRTIYRDYAFLIISPPEYSRPIAD